MDARRRKRVNRRRLFIRRAIVLSAALVLVAGVVVAIGAAAAGVRALLGAARPAVIADAPISRPSAPPFTSAFVRRGAPWSPAAIRTAASAASSIINAPQFPPTSAAILIEARTGRVLYEHNAHEPLVPASTMKVLTAAVALHDLGPGYRFQTQIVTGGPVDGDTVRSDVYLVGGGDPELSTDDLRAGVRRIKHEGISLIDGGVVADGSLFGADAVNSTWDHDDLEYGWAAPPSAVTVDNGSVQFTITPVADLGLAAVAIEPPSAAGRVVGHVLTASADADNTLHIDPLPDGSGFSLSGQIPYGAAQKYWRSVERPTSAAAGVLRMLTLADGVGVTGDASASRAPSGASTVLWSHRSRPLAPIVQKMMFDSDNHYAEQLLRVAGARTYGLGTLENGRAADRAFLTSLHADEPGLALVDGSGLSASNRVTVAMLGAAARSMLAGQDAWSELALLPRIGMEGTVQFRPVDPDVMGRIRGKDGYIEGASGLVGFVETAHHGVVVYAFLVDDWQQGLDAVWDGEDEILARIARM